MAYSLPRNESVLGKDLKLSITVSGTYSLWRFTEEHRRAQRKDEKLGSSKQDTGSSSIKREVQDHVFFSLRYLFRGIVYSREQIDQPPTPRSHVINWQVPFRHHESNVVMTTSPYWLIPAFILFLARRASEFSTSNPVPSKIWRLFHFRNSPSEEKWLQTHLAYSGSLPLRRMVIKPSVLLVPPLGP